MAGDVIHFKQSLFFLQSGQQPATEPTWRPLTDVYRTRDGWLVKFDLAGVRPEDVQLTVSGKQLTLRGVRRDFCSEEGCHHYQMEIAYSSFERRLSLPVALEQAKITIEHREGMLLVRIQLEDNRQ